MAEENDDQQVEQEESSKFQAITSQEELDRVIGARINKVKAQFTDYDSFKEKAAKFDAAEQASKSELEQEREAREQAERERDSLRIDGLRASVALAKGLTATQAKRLVGTTQEELEADADELIADLGATKPTPPKPQSRHLSSGSGSSNQETGKERAAAALRQMRTGG